MVDNVAHTFVVATVQGEGTRERTKTIQHTFVGSLHWSSTWFELWLPELFLITRTDDRNICTSVHSHADNVVVDVHVFEDLVCAR